MFRDEFLTYICIMCMYICISYMQRWYFVCIRQIEITVLVVRNSFGLKMFILGLWVKNTYFGPPPSRQFLS